MLEIRRVERDSAAELADWCNGVLVEEIDALDDDKRSPGINVPCRDGIKRASLNDRIIRYDDGTFDVREPWGIES